MNHVSSSVENSDIKRLQNWLETSVNDAERRTIRKLLAEEKLKGSLSVEVCVTSFDSISGKRVRRSIVGATKGILAAPS
jgi:hypothetical protein